MIRPTLFLLPLLVVAITASHQNYPGTEQRPILSDAEAALYTKEAFMGGWNPRTPQTSHADYTVGKGQYTRIQDAVNAAINAGGTARKYIKIEKGTYNQIVFIPKTTVPITIFGTVNKPEDVQITLSLGANMAISDWINQVNPGGKVFKQGDPAWSMYESCIKRPNAGMCSSLMWVQAELFEAVHLTINNPSTNGQALAVRASGNHQYWYNVHFYGFQDTLLAEGGANTKMLFYGPTIKGDVDFIYGDARAVFENAQIIMRSDRPRDSGVIFAPDHDYNQKLGFLVIHSKITAENPTHSKKGMSLARMWDASSKQGKVNGQVIIRETEIVDACNVNAPWGAATSGKAFHGNTNQNRNLDDRNYNRFWEYKNTGSGS